MPLLLLLCLLQLMLFLKGPTAMEKREMKK